MLPLLLLAAVGCGGPPDRGADPVLDPAAVEQTLRRWGDAALAGDRAAFDETVSSRDPAFAATVGRLFDDLGRLGTLRWEVGPGQGTLPPPRRQLLGPDAVVLPATVTWAPGDDEAPALRGEVWTTWVVDDGGPRLAGTGDGPDTPAAPTPAWWVEDVTVQQMGTATLVTGAAPDPGRWRARVDQALDAVEAAALDDARPDGPPPPVVVQVPSSRGLADRVAGSAGRLEGAAAVTVADTGGALPVLVDPGAGLSEESWVFLLTHELVHVRTASPGSGSPRWLVEGLAESVARRAQPDLLSTTREQAAAAAAEVGPLPTDEDLREHPAAGYLCSWVAVELLQDRLGRSAALEVVAATADGRPIAEVLAAAGVPAGALERDVEGALDDLAAGREVPALR